jgi:hypothetical protein
VAQDKIIGAEIKASRRFTLLLRKVAKILAVAAQFLFAERSATGIGND